MKIFKNSLWVLITLLIVGVSCNSKKSTLSEYGILFENVFKTDSAVFRGFNLGDNIEEVTKNEKAIPVEKDENYLYYEYKIDTATSYNIKYTFDEKGLVEIESDIFLNNTQTTEEEIEKFMQYFNDHYGDSESQGGYNVWSVKSKEFGSVKINLSNELPTDNNLNSLSKISVWIYPDRF